MDFLKGLNPQQQQAAAHVDGPLLILAGAGSGKTRVITHRIAHLVTAKQVYPSSILAVTFTNKASGEMRDRVAGLLAQAGAGEELPLVSTFHSFCVRLLRRDGATLGEVRPGFTRNFTIYDDDDQVALLKGIYKQIGIDDKFMPYRACLSRISHSKSLKETPQDIYGKASDPATQRIAVIYEKYEEKLRQANALDFDDLLLETVRLLQHDERLRTAYNQRIAYLMIDEYQDTNRSQYELMRLLSEKRHNVVVVGDEDQSIYSWRGADIRNILDFERDYPNAVTIRLEQNYRSTKNILQAASVVVANNKERKGKWLWTDSGEGDMVGFYEAPTAESEALFIADTIERTLSQRPEYRVAVLYRTNSQSRQIEEALRRYGRKYIVVGGFSFYQRAEVKDVLSYLKLLLSPQDSISLLRVINTPARGIGKSTIEQVEQYANQHNVPLWDALGQMLEGQAFPTRAEAAIRIFYRLIGELSALAKEQRIDRTMRDLLDRTGYTKMLETEATPEAETRIENLNELLNAAAEAAERGEDLTEFLDHAALVADSDNLDGGAAVSLLTMHNAKGLEFPVVFVAGLEEGLFPHSRSLNSESGMEEERRLCYVGMTRAEKRLYMTWARQRRRFGGSPPEASIPSRFLTEVPRELTLNLHEDESGLGGVDLFSERHEVRQTVKKNLYTGKTYNSLENIQQFFAERGMPAPQGLGGGLKNNLTRAAAPVVAAPPPAAVPPSMKPAVGASVPAPKVAVPPTVVNRPQAMPIPVAAKPAALGRKRGFVAGAVVQHPRYGRGTVLRREGDGDDAKLTVSFPGHGLKKLVEKFAGIKIDE